MDALKSIHRRDAENVENAEENRIQNSGARIQKKSKTHKPHSGF
jgi:hypothetical protein